MKLKLILTNFSIFFGLLYIVGLFLPSISGAQVFMMAESGKCLKGDGILLEKKVAAAPFTKISVEGAFLVNIVSGSKVNSITIKADKNLLEFIGIEVKSGLLQLKAKSAICSENPILLTLNVSSIEKIISKGASDITMTHLDNSRLDVNLDGSGTLEVSGKSAWLSAVVNGSTALRASALQAEKVDVISRGSSEAVVCVGKELKAMSEGASEIIYHGAPELLKIDERDVAEIKRAAEPDNTL